VPPPCGRRHPRRLRTGSRTSSFIWGDDIGWYNVSAYNLGVMGYRTPNIDRIAREGALFTDWYGQQSCTAGRAAFEPGTVYNEVFAHEDMLPTILAAAGVPDVKERLLKGYAAGGTTFTVHLDGYDLAPYWRGEAEEAPCKEFLYWNDDGKLVALRYNRWKLVFSEQRSHGFDVWQDRFVDLRLPALYDLRSDPFERASHESIGYPMWRVERAFLLVPAQAYVARWLATFKDFPPRQKPASFSLDQVMQKLQETGGSN
jgi:arylsulfatase A-like enzyme